jgi:DNA-binding response OmpR family regulator
MRDAPESRQWEQPREAPSLLRFAGFILDLDASTLVGETGEAVALTRGEFALLRIFVTRPGRVLSRDALLDALANRRFEPFDRSVDVMVGKLRRKIEPDSKQPRLIVTVPGEGYRFDGLAKSPLSGQGSRWPFRCPRTASCPRRRR